MFTSMGGHQFVRIVGKSMWFSLDDLRNMNELYTISICMCMCMCICICICFFPEPSNGVMTMRVIRPNHGSSARESIQFRVMDLGVPLLNMTWQQHLAGDF